MDEIFVFRRLFVALCVAAVLHNLVAYVSLPPAYAMALQHKIAQAADIRPFIDTENKIHLFQPFDRNITDPASVAAQYDLVWGASYYDTAAWRQGNPNIFLTYYILFHRDNGTFTDSTAIHDLKWWQANHPDWVLYKCDKKTPAYKFGDPNVPLDFSNMDVINWHIQTYALPASTSGYDGIAADNVDLGNWYGACGVYHKGSWVQLYTGQIDDTVWRNNIIFWLTQMQNALHALHPPLGLLANVSLADVPATDPLIQQVVAHLDGLLEEAGFTNQGKGYLTDNAWLQHIKLITSLQAQRKAYYSNNQFSSVGQQQIQWALASYLMGKDHAEALSITGYQQYGSTIWHQEYGAAIGSPSSDMYQDQQVYWRAYTNGIVIVNPSSTQTYTVALPSGVQHVDLYGNTVGPTVTLPIHTGLVLLVAA